MAGNVIPLSLDQTLNWKVRNFPDDVYNFDPSDYLTIFMRTLLGNAGTGQLTTLQITARLNQLNLEFSDLDNIMGQLLNTPRLSSEYYTINTNPFIDQLVRLSWQDVITKDSDYRERLVGVASSYLKGGTVFGIESVAEATSNVRFRVVESWMTAASGTNIPTTIASGVTSRGFGVNEVILVPNVPSDIIFNADIKHATLKSLGNLKPTGSIVTVSSGINGFSNPMNYTVVSGNSQFFSFDRQVTANNINDPAISSYNINDISYAGRYWLRNGLTTQAPVFAHLQSQEGSIDITQNINSVVVNSILPSGNTNQYTTTSMLGKSLLPVTSTIYGAQ